MKKYIIHKDGLKLLNKEGMEYSHLPYAVVLLTAEEVLLIRSKNIYCEEVKEAKAITLSNPDYDKEQSSIVKFRKKNITGRGVKIGVLDNAYASIIPYDYAVNFTDEDPSVAVHGVYTASMIKSSIGSANGVELHCIKVIKSGSSTSEADIIEGINYAIANNLDVLNMSFAFDPPTQALIDAIDAFWNNGGVMFASSGNNSAEDFVFFPAYHPKVIAVNGINEDGTATFKNYKPVNGHGIDICIGGVGIHVMDPSGDVLSNNGTSFSAPMATALFALHKEQLGLANNHQVLQYMLNTAIKQPDTQAFGRGIINA